MAKTKKEQQGRILPREDFQLVSIKLNQPKGTEVIYKIPGSEDEFKKSSKTKVHPDLTNTFKELHPYFAEKLLLVQGWNFLRGQTKGDLDLAEKIKKGYDEMIDRMNVTGITYKDDPNSENYGVVISGSFKATSKNIGCAIGKIKLNSEEAPEEDVKDICERITDEAYNYVILKKKEQTSVEDQAEGFDNNGGVQMDLVTESEQETLKSGLE